MSNPKQTPPDALDPPPTPEEIAAAGALRDALADPSRAHAAADFARAVSLAHGPREVDPQEHARIVEGALARGEARKAAAQGRRRGVVVRASFGVAGALAMAAAFALVVTEKREAPSAMAVSAEATAAPLAQARSTQPLFHEPFARAAAGSARIDRIATARAADLRDNRFAAWGVR